MWRLFVADLALLLLLRLFLTGLRAKNRLKVKGAMQAVKEIKGERKK